MSRKRKSSMTSSEEYTGRNIFKQNGLLLREGCHPFYEETCLSLPFQKQNGEKRNRSGEYRENTLRSSETDICIAQREKMRENCMTQNNAPAISMERGNRRKLSFSCSVEFTPVSGWGRGSHPLPFRL
jgi:hypothetical protein